MVPRVCRCSLKEKLLRPSSGTVGWSPCLSVRPVSAVSFERLVGGGVLQSGNCTGDQRGGAPRAVGLWIVSRRGDPPSCRREHQGGPQDSCKPGPRPPGGLANPRSCSHPAAGSLGGRAATPHQACSFLHKFEPSLGGITFPGGQISLPSSKARESGDKTGTPSQSLASPDPSLKF